MLIDTHAHLWFDEFRGDLEEVVKNAKDAGVEKIIVPGTDRDSSLKALELAKKYPGVIYAAMGMHPEGILNKEYRISNMEEIRKILLNKNDVVAIGEIGTDASTDELKSCMDQQRELFKLQCEIALEHDLPVIIHTRNSFDEAWEVLNSLPTMPRGQFHCFSMDEEALKKVLAHGFYVSFAGNITWSKRVAKLVSLVPDDRLLLETDSPLMVPRDVKGVPIGGSERNEPSNVAYLAQKIAELRGQNAEEIEKFTSENANRLYKL